MTTFSKRHYEKNKETVIEKATLWKQNNVEKTKIHRKTYSTSIKGITSRKNASYKRLYGITLDEYQEIFKNQNYVCAICNKKESRSNTIEIDGIKQLVVDHCHETNKVRGLLCTKCNLLLGYSEDSISILETAIKYLKENG